MARRIRSIILMLAVLLGIVVAALMAAIRFGPDWAQQALERRGLTGIVFETELAIDRLAFSNIAFGRNGEQSIGRLAFDFDLVDLLSNRSVRRVRIAGLDVHLIWDPESGPMLAGLALPRTESTGSAFDVARIPVREIAITDARVRMDTPRGRVDIGLGGELLASVDGDLALDAAVLGHFRDIEGKLAVSGARAEDGSMRLYLVYEGPSTEQDRPSRVDARIDLAVDDEEVLRSASNIQLADGEIDMTFERDGEAVDIVIGTTSIDLAGLTVLVAPWFDQMPALTGNAALDIDLTGDLPPSLDGLIEGVRADARVGVRTEGVGVPGIVTELTGRLSANTGIGPDAVTLQPIGDWSVAGALVADARPVRLELGSGEMPLALRLERADDGMAASGAVRFDLAPTGLPAVSGEVQGALEYPPGGRPTYDVQRLVLDAEPITIAGLHIRPRDLTASLAGEGLRVSGSVETTADVDGQVAGVFALDKGRAAFKGRFEYGEAGLTLYQEACAPVEAAGLEVYGVRARAVSTCAGPLADRPLVRLDPDGGLAVAVALPEGEAAVEAYGVAIEGVLPAFELALERPAAGVPALALTAAGGRMRIPGYGLVVEDIALGLVETDQARAHLDGGLRSNASPPGFAPLAVRGTLEGDLGGPVSYAFNARAEGLPASLTATGEHDLGLAIGHLRYTLDEIRFGPGLQPGDLSPPLRKLFKNTRGSLAASGELSWIADVVVAYHSFGLNGLGFDAPGLKLRGMDTRLTPVTRGLRNALAPQEMRVELLDVGIPLRNGVVRFNAHRAPAVKVEKTLFFWGGGLLELEPFELRVDALDAENRFVLNLADIDFDALLQLVSIDGLSATGALKGRIPVRIKGGEIGISNGKVTNTATGVLRYEPRIEPTFFAKNHQTALLRRALENFRYEQLEIGLDGSTGADIDLDIALNGSNRRLYDGRPFRLNFNINGELDRIIEQSITISTFADRLGKTLSSYPD